jgi:hypothetical protein
MWHNRAAVTLAPSRHALAQITAGGVERGQQLGGAALISSDFAPNPATTRCACASVMVILMSLRRAVRGAFISAKKTSTPSFPSRKCGGVRLAVKSHRRHRIGHRPCPICPYQCPICWSSARRSVDCMPIMPLGAFVFPSQSETFGLSPRRSNWHVAYPWSHPPVGRLRRVAP